MYKKPFVAAGLCLLAMVFSACAEKPQAEPTTITLMHGWNGIGTDHVAMRSIYDDFQKQNPDIKLLYDASPDISNVIDKVKEMLAVDKMPDIISTNGYTGLLESAVKKGLVLDLAPYIEQDKVFEANINPLVINSWKNADGSIYTVPDVMEHFGYWYNESLFLAAGITQDGTPNTPVKLPQTWAEFWAACEALDKIKETSGALPIVMQSGQMNSLLGACLAAQDGQGRKMMQGEDATCTKEEAKAAVDNILIAAKYADSSVSNMSTWQKFFEGKLAIYLNGAWANTERMQTQEKQNIKYAAFPSDTKETVAYVSPPTGYIVNKNCTQAQKDAAVKFIKYMVSEDVQKRIVIETKQAPSNPKISPEWISETSPPLGKAISVCTSADVKIASILLAYNEKAQSEIVNCLEQMIYGEDSSDKLISIITDKASTE